MPKTKEEQNLQVTILGISAIVAIFAIVFASFYFSDTSFNYQTKKDNYIPQFASISSEDKDLVGGASRAFTSSQPQTNSPSNQNSQTSQAIPIDQLLEQKSNSLSPMRSSQVVVRGNDNEQIIVGTGLGINSQLNMQTLPQTIAQNAVAEKFDGYIVKLKDKSVAEKFNELDKRIGAAKAQNILELKKYRAELLSKQEAEIKSIKTLIPNLKVKRKFSTAFNGFHVNLTQQEAQKIRSKGYKVWQNMQVKAVLMDSVPLIGADDVWKLDSDLNPCETTGKDCLTGKGIKIAIIDTGVDYTHEDLGGCFGQGCKVEGGYDVVECDEFDSSGNCILPRDPDTDPMDDQGHGTHVAATAAGNGVLKGVAPDADIIAYKVLNNDGVGLWSWVIDGIGRAIDPNQDGDFSDKADIISMSLGGFGDPDDPQSQAVDNAVNVGTIAVIAAGNSGPDGNPYCRHESSGNEQSICSPGTAREAITVGATYKSDVVASFSSRGPVIWNDKSLIKPDIVAPGVNICAAQWDDWLSELRCLDDKHIFISGTSMATPHVAGAAALLKQKSPDWEPKYVKAAIRNNALNIGHDTLTQGYGRIEALAAVKSKKPPISKLDSPLYLAKSLIEITGTAAGDNFKEYSLYLGNGHDPQNFDLLTTSSVPIVNGILYKWLDTTKLNDGQYIIKLLVKDLNGTTNEDRAIIKIDYMKIISIGDTLNYLNKGRKKVKGRITLPGISKYKVEYSKDFSRWNVVCSQSQLPVDDVLCEFNVDPFDNGLYYFRISAQKNGTWLTDEPFKAAVVHEMLDNWPVEINGFPRSHQKVANLDSDVSNELLVPHYRECGSNYCKGSKLLIYEADGKFSELEFLKDRSRVYPDDMPVIYNDVEHNQNLIVSLLFPNGGAQIFDRFGYLKYKWKGDAVPQDFYYYPPMTFFDTDSDNVEELYFTVYERSTEEIRLYGFDKSGQLLNGFPIRIQKEKYEHTLEPNIDRAQILLLKQEEKYNLAVIAGDFEYSRNYGQKLVLYLDIYSKNGGLVKRTYLFDDPSKSVRPLRTLSSASDFNGDGNVEIVVGYSIIDEDLYSKNRYDMNAYKTYIKIFDSKGDSVGQTYAVDGYTIKGIVIGDLGGNAPIIIATFDDTWPTTNNGQKLITLNSKGNVLFDRNLKDYNDIIGGTSTGDIDGDGESEIVINHARRWWDGGDFGIQIFDMRGQLKEKILLPSLGATADYGFFPLLTDLDADGNTDVVLQYLYFPEDKVGIEWDTRLYALKIGKSFNNDRMDWPTILHDNQHTSVYQIKKEPQKLPDLTIPQASITKERIGYSYKALVSNTGTKDSGHYVFQVKEQNLPARAKTLSSLKPGESKIVHGKIARLPVTFTVDPKNLIKEMNENNNVLTITKPTPTNFPDLQSENGP